MPDNENSVKGFNTDAGVLRYDYNSLDNLPNIPEDKLILCEYEMWSFDEILAQVSLGKYAVCLYFFDREPVRLSMSRCSIHGIDFEGTYNHNLINVHVTPQNEWSANIDGLLTNNLQIEELDTTDKHVVGAINEVNADVRTRAKTVNGVGADENGNIPISIPEPYDDTEIKEEVSQLKTKTLQMPQDVQINGNSILDENNVANIPNATTSSYGLVKPRPTSFWINNNGQLILNEASNGAIDLRSSERPICTSSLDYAVKQAMCDGKGAEWTDAEKASAQKRIGVGGKFELIESITLTEESSLIRRTSEPNGTPYNFKAVYVYIEFPALLHMNVYVSLGNTIFVENTLITSNSRVNWYSAVSEYGFLRIMSGTSTGQYKNSTNMSRGRYIETMDKVTALSIGTADDTNAYPVGTSIKIYGVRN